MPMLTGLEEWFSISDVGLGVYRVSCMRSHRAVEVILAAAKDGILSQEVLVKGLQDVLETVPDVAIDVPQVGVAPGAGRGARDTVR